MQPLLFLNSHGQSYLTRWNETGSDAVHGIAGPVRGMMSFGLWRSLCRLRKGQLGHHPALNNAAAAAAFGSGTPSSRLRIVVMVLVRHAGLQPACCLYFCGGSSMSSLSQKRQPNTPLEQQRNWAHSSPVWRQASRPAFCWPFGLQDLGIDRYGADETDREAVSASSKCSIKRTYCRPIDKLF